MSTIAFRACLAALALACAARAQLTPQIGNDLPLNNEGDVFFLFSDPSVGASTGSFPPDFGGDLYWKVLPRDVLRTPSGTIELSALEFEITDSDPSTPAAPFDLMITRGKPSAIFPGAIQPDFSDPNAVFLSLGTGVVPSICTFVPAFCPPTCLPIPPDISNSWTIRAQLGTCAGDGLVFPADGTQDLVVTAFVPGGMTSSGPGSCPSFTGGDYVSMDLHSTDETPAAWLGFGLSGLGGFQIGGSAFLHPDLIAETWALRTEFCTPILNTAISTDPFFSGAALVGTPWASVRTQGIAGVHPSIGSGVETMQYVLYDKQGIGDVAFAAASLAPLLPAPGLNLFGAFLLLNPTDPTVTASLRSGPVLAKTVGGPPNDDGIFASGAPLPLPAGAAGLTISSQALILDPGTFTARSSQVTRTHLHF